MRRRRNGDNAMNESKEIQDAIDALTMCKELMLFNPNTGETTMIEDENRDNQALYYGCITAIRIMSQYLYPCSICKDMAGLPGSGFVAKFCPNCGRKLS